MGTLKPGEVAPDSGELVEVGPRGGKVLTSSPYPLTVSLNGSWIESPPPCCQPALGWISLFEMTTAGSILLNCLNIEL
jgi:hypothetical protein